MWIDIEYKGDHQYRLWLYLQIQNLENLATIDWKDVFHFISWWQHWFADKSFYNLLFSYDNKKSVIPMEIVTTCWGHTGSN